jgi:hypothetical protein
VRRVLVAIDVAIDVSIDPGCDGIGSSHVVGVFGQELICNNSGVWESIHASADFDVDVAIMGNVIKFVGINDLLW